MRAHVGSHLRNIGTLLVLILSLAACAGASSATSPPAGSSPSGTLEIHAIDMGFDPSRLSVDKPGRYAVMLVNDGAILHDITFPDGTKIVANRKETVMAEVDVPERGLSFICSVPGHADAGMKGTIVVDGNTGDATTPDGHS
jgi:uncharacterized cupredoxin-like copper-binding protein